MKVNENLEERLFCADIEALRAYDTDFDNLMDLMDRMDLQNAMNNNNSYFK